MEPFGLFQFLQSLLQNPPTQENQEDTNAAEPVVETNPPPPPTVNETYLQFIANHEKRSQGIKKK